LLIAKSLAGAIGRIALTVCAEFLASPNMTFRSFLRQMYRSQERAGVFLEIGRVRLARQRTPHIPAPPYSANGAQ